MNISRIVHQLRELIADYSEIFSEGLSKPRSRFVAQMLYGIQASKDVKLSNIARVLQEEIELKKTEERLSRNLAQEGFADIVLERVAQEGSRRIHKDTLLIIDPSDIKKPYAKKMPYLAKVRDGSAEELVDGYWTCHIVACEVKSRRMIPLSMRLWSAEAPDFGSENKQILQGVDTVRKAVPERGIWVMDKGGDRGKLLKPFLERKMQFIVRLRGDRHLLYKGKKVETRQLADSCPLLYAEHIVKQEKGDEKSFHLEYGFRKVHLPGREEQLYLVVAKGFGKAPLMLITNRPLKKSRKSLWFVVEAYLSRWLVEEKIRFIKQSYNLEDIRLLDYERLRNMLALVLAAAFFASVKLGESMKLAVLAKNVTRMAKRFFGVPDFHYYALVDGISRFLSFSTQGPACHSPVSSTIDYQQYLFDMG